MKKILVLLLICTLIVSTAFAEQTGQGAMGKPALLSDYWTEGSEAASKLNDYLLAVTDEASPDYIPVEDRLAVFDLDGTLMCETYPFCFEYMVFADYALKHADTMPEDVLAVAQEIVDATGEDKPNDMSTRQAAAAAIAYKGMTMEELAQVVADFKDSAAWGFTGLTRGEAWFKPMVELFEKLQANDFDVYVVTATERNIVREIVRGVLDIPPSHVIGTEYGYVAINQGDAADADYTFKPEDQIVFDGNYYGENAKTSKVDAIVREIGQQPVLAFGNSSGDVAMEIYTISNNPYRSAAFMVVADDEDREHGDAEGAAEKKAGYEAQGIDIISMRDDFETIYGQGVAVGTDSEAVDAALEALQEARAEKSLEALKAELDVYVAEGKLTQEQADLIVKHFQEEQDEASQNSWLEHGDNRFGGRKKYGNWEFSWSFGWGSQGEHENPGWQFPEWRRFPGWQDENRPDGEAQRPCL